jgi:hypothetical protein
LQHVGLPDRNDRSASILGVVGLKITMSDRSDMIATQLGVSLGVVHRRLVNFSETEKLKRTTEKLKCTKTSSNEKIRTRSRNSENHV